MKRKTNIIITSPLIAAVAGLALTAGTASGQITQDFESTTAPDVPTGWATIGVGAEGTYATTAGEGNPGQSGNLDWTASNQTAPGVYLVNSGAAFDATKPISGSFDFYVVEEGNYSNANFIIGDVQDGLTGDAGEFINVWMCEQQFGTRARVYDGSNTLLFSGDGNNNYAFKTNEWVSATFTWTPTAGKTGTFSVLLDSPSFTNSPMVVTNYTFDSAAAYFGFGTGKSASRFDNISITGTPFTGNYWDSDGATAGAGGTTPTGTWGTDDYWSVSATGEAATGAWAAGASAVFAAGTDATGTYTVTVDGSQDIGGLFVEEGSLTLADGTSGALNVTASDTTLLIQPGADATIEVPFTDSGTEVLSKGGDGTLILNADNSGATGGLVLGGGVTQFESPASINGSGETVTLGSLGTMVFGASFVDTNIPAALDRIITTSSGTVAADNYAATAFDLDTPGLTDVSLGAVGSVAYTGTLTPAGTTYRLGGGGGTLTMSNGFGGAGDDLAVRGPGTVILGAANAYDGSTSVTDATLQLNAASSLPSGTTLSLSNGTLRLNGNDTTVAVGTLDGGAFENGSASTAATLTVDNSSAITFQGTIQDGGAAALALTKDGSGNLRLVGDQGYTGNTTISNGILEVGSRNDGGGTLGGGSYSGNISIAAGSELWHWNDTQEFSGIISGDGAVWTWSGSNLTLSGENTYTGETRIWSDTTSGSSLTVSSLNSVTAGSIETGSGTVATPVASSSLGAPSSEANGTIYLSRTGKRASCTLRYVGLGETTDRIINVGFDSSSKQTIDADGTGLLKFTSPFAISAGSGTSSGGIILRGTGDGEVAEIGTIPGSLEKNDGGTWTVNGTNSVDATTVSAGKLLVNGTFTSRTGTFNVNGTSTLGGTATISDSTPGTVSVVLAAGASLEPGTSVGTLTVDGALDISAPAGGAGLLNFELDTTAASDQIAVTGALNIGSGALGLSDFSFSDLGGLENGTYTLISSGGLTGSIDGGDSTATDAIGDADFELQISGNDVVLAVTGLPGGGPSYATWSSGAGANDDTNGDGVENAVAYVLGAADVNEVMTGKVPTLDNSDPDFFIFNFRRSDDAEADATTAIAAQYGTDLSGWTTAVDDATDVIITPTDDFYDTGVDKVEVKLRRSVLAPDGRLFARLLVTVTP
ncbi:beta strand repeat-containing protein [Haloferula sp. A504]|uniref:beta strand repeat-containing protein n=1 Tax=Haloferula sp. A504 TaxID=3373601 RepID=UPI0031CA9274|nr:autotransporter-associated beta strand repeat-containing protein [Verrucomicrobiaceae bacterium E54]